MNKTINVLHIITRLDAGGSATNTIETVARLDPSQFRVHLIVGKTTDPNGTIRAMLQKRGVSFEFIEELVREINPLKDFFAYHKILRHLRLNRYDIVHTHSSKAGILGRWAARRARIRCIVHTPHGHVFRGYFNPFITWLFVVAERITARFTDTIITLTDKGRQDHLDFKIAQPYQFVTIPSGIDIEMFQNCSVDIPAFRHAKQADPTDFILCTAGRLEAIKGIKYLIEAMPQIVQEIPQAKLWILGDGPLADDLKDLAKKQPCAKHIRFWGQQNQLADFFHSADIFILPSLNEGMGRVILEAMACGKPVIASRVGGIPDLVRDGINGILVEPQRADLLAQAVIRLFAHPQLYKSCSNGARATVGEQYSLNGMIRQIEALYRLRIKEEISS